MDWTSAGIGAIAGLVVGAGIVGYFVLYPAIAHYNSLLAQCLHQIEQRKHQFEELYKISLDMLIKLEEKEHN